MLGEPGQTSSLRDSIFSASLYLVASVVVWRCSGSGFPSIYEARGLNRNPTTNCLIFSGEATQQLVALLYRGVEQGNPSKVRRVLRRVQMSPLGRSNANRYKRVISNSSKDDKLCKPAFANPTKERCWATGHPQKSTWWHPLKLPLFGG